MACSCGSQHGGMCRGCGNRTHRQMGGELRYPQGLIKQGSGRIDSTSSEGLPIDDVPAILGHGEYVFNANAVDKLGTKFLDNLNNIGLNDYSSIQPDTLGYGSKYQGGGQVDNRSTTKKFTNRILETKILKHLRILSSLI